jgi:hypothetical protein
MLSSGLNLLEKDIPELAIYGYAAQNHIITETNKQTNKQTKAPSEWNEEKRCQIKFH